MTAPTHLPRRAIVCFGEALIDLLARPAEGQEQPRSFVEFAGGAPANVAVAVARLGGHARFVGMLGADTFGDSLVAQLNDAGVDVRYICRTRAAKTALAIVTLDRDGERSFEFYRTASADLLFRDEHFDPRCFEDAAIFHLCSNSLSDEGIAVATLAGMRRAHKAGALVSMDLNFRPSLWPDAIDPTPHLWDALKRADLVKLSRTEIEFLAGRLGGEHSVIERLLHGNAQWVLITDGGAPVRWFTRSGQGSTPSFSVRAIDTTAAGDAFVGALLQRLVAHGVNADKLCSFLLDREAVADTLRHATAAGALATTRHGAFAAMPTQLAVNQLIRASA